MVSSRFSAPCGRGGLAGSWRGAGYSRTVCPECLQRLLTFIDCRGGGGKTGSWNRGKMNFFLILEDVQYWRTGTVGTNVLNLWM